MNSPLKYKEYSALIGYDDECELFRGEILDINDTIVFYGDSISSLKQAMADAVEDYLEHCQEIGRTPEKPYSGKISLRITPQLHKNVARRAALERKSINFILSEFIEKGLLTSKTKVAKKESLISKTKETYISSRHTTIQAPHKSEEAWARSQEAIQ